MAREFRQRSVADYGSVDQTLTRSRTFLDDRFQANRIGMKEAEERLGVDSDLYAMFQSRAIAWASK